MNSLPLNRIIEESHLYEGLIYTHNVQVTVSHLNQRNANEHVAFFRFGSENRLGILLTDKLSLKELKNIITKLNNYGWFPSYYYSKALLGTKYAYSEKELLNFYPLHQRTVVVCDAKYDLEVSAEQYDVLYHISPDVYKDKILRVGRAPRSKNKTANHPDRIYLATNKNEAVNLATDNKFYPEHNYFTVFEIDLKKLNARREIKFFRDPAFKGGVYTYENIPPQYITVCGEIKT